MGKIKSLKVSGKNEAPSYPGMWLPNLMIVPDDDWTNTVVRGKMPEDVTKTPDWSSKLKKALEMAKGPLPSQLSQELATFTDLGAAPAGKLMKPPNGRDALKRPALGVHARTTPVLPAKVLRRPERSGAKRSYDDTSFAGYGEGFVDEDDGNSTDSRLDHKKKRQRTVGSDQTLPVCASTNWSLGIRCSQSYCWSLQSLQLISCMSASLILPSRQHHRLLCFHVQHIFLH